MRIYIVLLLAFSPFFVSAQVDIHTGIYFHGQGGLYGSGVSIGYEYPISSKFNMKSQIGAKFLSVNNDFLDADLSGRVYEIHQILSYRILNKPKFSLSFAFGLNYRDFDYDVSFRPPLDQLPNRGIYIGFRNGELAASTLANPTDDHQENNIGYTAYLQQKFKLSDRVGLYILAVVEDDYDRSQTIGGASLGLSFAISRK